jgi:hypothetical protein
MRVEFSVAVRDRRENSAPIMSIGRTGYTAAKAETSMLKDLNVDQARFIAILAKTARMQRDALVGHVPEDDLDGLTPGRGEHNPTAAIGFEPLAQDAPQIAALREAISTLSPAARFELYALMRIGQGDLAANKWHRGITEAQALGDETVTAALMEDIDLHDHLSKGLYEAKIAS